MRRGPRARWAAAVAVGLAAIATPACGDEGGGDCCSEPPGSEAGRDWEELPGPGPSGDALADVGGTVLVVGGGEVRALEDDGWSLPAEVPGGAIGGGPVVATDDELILATAGVAYEPGSGTWRDLPGGPGGVAAAVWTGEAVVVFRDAGHDRVQIYDDAGGEPREIEPPGGTIIAAVPVPGGAVVWTDDETYDHGTLSRLDTRSGQWAELPPPPFEPREGGTGLVAEGNDRLVAASFRGSETQATALDLPSGDEWEALHPPPAPDRLTCPIDLHRGEAATVFGDRCSGALSVLDGDRWASLPPSPVEADGDVLVTTDQVLVLAGDGSALARRPLP